MMTEETAKERWCPFTRFAIWSSHGTSAAANRLGDDDGVQLNHRYCRCIGSQCMAWRLEYNAEESLIDAIRRYRAETLTTLKDAKDYVETHPEYRRRPKPNLGWCGLAGEP